MSFKIHLGVKMSFKIHFGVKMSFKILLGVKMSANMAMGFLFFFFRIVLYEMNASYLITEIC